MDVEEGIPDKAIESSAENSQRLAFLSYARPFRQQKVL